MVFRGATADIPALGPVWFGVVMSTAAVPPLLLLYLGTVPNPWLGVVHGVAFACWCAAAVVCFLLTSTFGYRCIVDHSRFTRTWTTAQQVLPWGAAAIGFLALGAATPVALPSLWPGTFAVTRALTWPLWVIGSIIGLACLTRFTQLAWARRAGQPTVGWGLAVMPTLVGSNLTAEMGVLYPGYTMDWFLAVMSAVQFAIGVSGALVVFVVGYVYVLRGETVLAPAVYPTLFMPIGLAGQSAASAQQQLLNVSAVASPAMAELVHTATVVQSAVLLPVGAAALVYALVRFSGGALRGTPFTPAWLSMAYPLASMAAGTSGLGTMLDAPLLYGAGVVVALIFGVLWVVGLVAAGRALYQFRERWLAPFRVANLSEYVVQRWQAWRNPARRSVVRVQAEDGEHAPIKERPITLDE